MHAVDNRGAILTGSGVPVRMRIVHLSGKVPSPLGHGRQVPAGSILKPNSGAPVRTCLTDELAGHHHVVVRSPTWVLRL